ncbi:MAG: response regulator transcription factor [Dehalococcoidia bacterium]
MTKILLVDDEAQMVTFLERLFEDAGYTAITAQDGMNALREFFVARPDVAIIDLLMPQMDGFELCRRIREISHIPIIVLTGLEQVSEKVNAFNAGADDYVTKPVSGRELIARVEACLRRSQWPPATETSSVYSDSQITVDFTRREVYVDGENKDLTPIEYALLSLFVQRPGEALSLEYLLTSVWGREYDTLDLVKWHISNLRKKLKNTLQHRAEPSPIVTVRGYGYRYKRPSD